jgi:hypothetical protein
VAYTAKNNKVFVEDLFAVDMENTARSLLLQFASVMRQQAVDSVFLMFAGNPSFGATLRRSGFIPRGDTHRPVVLLAGSLADSRTNAITDARNWFLFDGEADI